LVIVFVESKFQNDPGPPPKVSLKRNIIVEIECGNKVVFFFPVQKRNGKKKGTSDDVWPK